MDPNLRAQQHIYVMMIEEGSCLQTKSCLHQIDSRTTCICMHLVWEGRGGGCNLWRRKYWMGCKKCKQTNRKGKIQGETEILSALTSSGTDYSAKPHQPLLSLSSIWAVNDKCRALLTLHRIVGIFSVFVKNKYVSQKTFMSFIQAAFVEDHF